MNIPVCLFNIYSSYNVMAGSGYVCENERGPPGVHACISDGDPSNVDPTFEGARALLPRDSSPQLSPLLPGDMMTFRHREHLA